SLSCSRIDLTPRDVPIGDHHQRSVHTRIPSTLGADAIRREPVPVKRGKSPFEKVANDTATRVELVRSYLQQLIDRNVRRQANYPRILRCSHNGKLANTIGTYGIDAAYKARERRIQVARGGMISVVIDQGKERPVQHLHPGPVA